MSVTLHTKSERVPKQHVGVVPLDSVSIVQHLMVRHKKSPRKNPPEVSRVLRVKSRERYFGKPTGRGIHNVSDLNKNFEETRQQTSLSTNKVPERFPKIQSHLTWSLYSVGKGPSTSQSCRLEGLPVLSLTSDPIDDRIQIV